MGREVYPSPGGDNHSPQAPNLRGKHYFKPIWEALRLREGKQPAQGYTASCWWSLGLL